MQPETRFKLRLRPRLEAIPRSWWLKTQERVTRGIPDFLGVVNRQPVAIELKTEDGALDALQKYTLGRIEAAGGRAYVMRPSNMEEILAELASL